MSVAQFYTECTQALAAILRNNKEWMTFEGHFLYRQHVWSRENTAYINNYKLNTRRHM